MKNAYNTIYEIIAGSVGFQSFVVTCEGAKSAIWHLCREKIKCQIADLALW